MKDQIPVAATQEQLVELRSLLDRYLIADLETMADIRKDSGGLGYPMIQTLLGGMELVGMLFSGSRNAGAFEKFWKELVKDHPQYKGAHGVFRTIRNSSAHLFLVHVGIQLSKNSVDHLKRTDEGLLNIDLLSLFEDFLRTYDRMMSEACNGSRDAVGYTRVRDELTKELAEIQAFTANLPLATYASYNGSETPQIAPSGSPGVSGTPGPGTALWFSVAPSPGASATWIPPTEDESR